MVLFSQFHARLIKVHSLPAMMIFCSGAAPLAYRESLSFLMDPSYLAAGFPSGSAI